MSEERKAVSRAPQTHTRSVTEICASDIHVVFQPIVSVETGDTFALEALCRCQWPEFQNPQRLFEQAEAEKCCGQLGRSVREVAFDRVQDTPLFVNLHPHELSQRWLVRPDDPLCFHGADVYLEITETAAFAYFDLCVNVLKEVCSRTGALLVIDDFGAGYSNLKRIVDLEPSIVKLDLALTRGIDRSKRQRLLVKHVVRLCEDLGAKVVAEGIETIDELRAVIDCGVHYGQGYLIAKPAFPAHAPVWPLDVGSGIWRAG
jgi:EAL domain-containing protein (putative c-di-GMP-specific phosphodiesterase class I)